MGIQKIDIDLKSIEWEEEVISKKTLIEKTDVCMRGQYVWDSHGNYHPFEHKGHKTISRKCCNIKVVEEIRKIHSKYSPDIDFTIWRVYLNNELLDTECDRYNYNPATNTITLKLVCGRG